MLFRQIFVSHYFEFSACLLGNLLQCSLCVHDLSNVSPKYFEVKLCFSSTPLNLTDSFLLASLLFRWKQQTSVLFMLGHNLHFLKNSPNLERSSSGGSSVF